MRNILKSIKLSVSKKPIAYLREHSPEWLEKNLRVANDASGVVYYSWQLGGGYDRYITNAVVAWASVDYIHKNPVRRGLAMCETDWGWSSARWYAGMGCVVMAVDNRAPDS